MNSVPRFQRSKGGISTVVATAAGCLGLFAAGVLGQGLLAEGLAAAFLTATAAIAGWMCGVRWGTAILALAAILQFALDSRASERPYCHSRCAGESQPVC